MTKRKWLDISIISAITCALLIPSLSSGFVNLDDNFYVTGNFYIRHLTLRNIEYFFTSFHHGVYAPIQYLTYMFVYRISDYHALFYHLTGIVFYLLPGIMVYLIVDKIQDSRSIAFFSAFLFLISPVNIDSAVWVAELKNPQSLSFFLASFYLYMLFRERKVPPGKKDALPGRAKKFYLCSLAAFSLGLLVKPPGATVLLMMFLYDLMNEQDIKDSIKKLSPYALMTGPFMIVYMIGQSTIGSYHGLIRGSLWSQIKTIIAVAAGIFEYPSKLILPVNLSVAYPIDTIIPSPVFAASMGAVVLITAVIRHLMKMRDKRPVFWLGWYFVNMLPYYGIIAMPFFADWYLYIPSIGIYTLIIISITALTDMIHDRTPENPERKSFMDALPWLAYALLIFIVLVFGFFGFKRQFVWENDIRLWKSSLQSVGPDPYVLRNLSIAYFKHDQPYKGIESGMELLDKTPDFVMMKYLIGKGYAQLGNYVKAMDVLKDALDQLAVLDKKGTSYMAVMPGLGDTPATLKSMIYTEMSEIQSDTNQIASAISLLNDAINAAPYAPAYEKLAYIYTQINRINDAKDILDRITVLKPDEPDPWRMLGYITAEYYNNKQLAVQYFEKSLELAPEQNYAYEMETFIKQWKTKAH